MGKAKRRLKSGQVTLLILLIGVLGLTLGLSAASRAVSDLKQASTVNVGTKALAAAESGIEAAQNALASNPNPSYNPCVTVNNPFTIPGISSISYQICGAAKNTVEADIDKDEVLDIDLSQQSPNAFNYNVYWNGSSTPILVSVVTNSSGYAVDRFAFNPIGYTGPANNFDTSKVGTGLSCGDGSYAWCATLYASGNRTHDVLMRVRPLYNSSKIKVESTRPGNPTPPVLVGAYYTITATAQATNGTVKKIQVTKFPYAGLPAAFDNVIFSGGDLSK